MHQPWAAALIWGGKSPENRGTGIVGDYRGPVAIHAGLIEDDWAYDEQVIKDWLSTYDDSWVLQEQLQTGVFLGVVDLVDAHRPDERSDCCLSPWAQWERWHLAVRNPRPLPEPIPARGMLGLWTPPAEVLEQLQAVV